MEETKMVKKYIKRISAVVLSAALLGSCGTGSGGGTKELTMHLHLFGYCVYDESWPLFQKASEITGIKIKGTASKSISDSEQAWNTMIAAKPLPDIIDAPSGKLLNLAEMGGMIPLDDLIEQHAPNVKKFFEDCPEARDAATYDDGHIYYIPGSLSGIDKPAVASKGWFIRTDWLEKLGLEAPKTVEDMYKVLTAFKTKDPNGNGKADEIPYFNRQDGIQDLYQLFGAEYSWYATKDGKVVNGKAEEAYHNAVREIAKWYKEGLIDTEIFSRGQQSREQLLSTDVGGMTHDWFSSTGKYNDMYKDSVPGLKFEAMLPPADINGEVKEARSRSVLHGYGWGISKDCKDPEAAMKYFDFWMSQEGRDLNAFGIEGVHYTVVDGEKKFTDEVLNAEGGVPTYMRNQGQVEIGTVGNIAAEVAGMNDIARAGFEMYEDSGVVRKEFVMPNLTKEEKDKLTDLTSNIKTYISEMEQKWILGTSDIDADWDNYIKTLKDMGLETVNEVYTEAYNRHNK